MTVNQISVFVENKSGALAQIAGELAAAGVNMRALSSAAPPDFEVLRFIADQEEKAASILRANGHVLTITPVLAVALKDEPGSFARITGVLAGAGLDVEYVYAFLTPRPDTACMIFRVADNDAAEKALSAAGIQLAAKDDLS